MLKLSILLFVFQLLISAVVADKTNRTVSDIYSKFKQNDYNLTVEWVELVRYKKPEVTYSNLTTFKYNRTCTALNISYTLTADFEYEPEAIVQAYRFASNEYRLFPLRFQANICKAIASNMVGARLLMNCGNFMGCPIRKGTYHVCNWVLDQSRFPPLIPTGRYMMEMQFFYREMEISLSRTYIAISRSLVKK